MRQFHSIFMSVASRVMPMTISGLVSLLALVTVAFASPVNVDSNGIAIQGHDPVSYFTDGKPVKGSSDYSAEHNGAIYHFASMEHQEIFKANPDKYAPQYGGYCAYGLSYGSKAPVEVDKFSVVDGKLYLNFNGNIQSRWEKDISGHVSKANANWKKIK